MNSKIILAAVFSLIFFVIFSLINVDMGLITQIFVAALAGAIWYFISAKFGNSLHKK